jgi:hypothetical protein
MGSGAGSSALTTSANFARPACLDRITSKAVVARSDLRNSSSNVVKPTIFVPGSIPRRTEAVATPFIFGMLRSRITSAGAHSSAFSIAATPSPASQQALKGVALSMNWRMASRTAALSSTTRIHGVRGVRMEEETTSVSCLGQYEFSLIFVHCALAAERHSAGNLFLGRLSKNCSFLGKRGHLLAVRDRCTYKPHTAGFFRQTVLSVASHMSDFGADQDLAQNVWTETRADGYATSYDTICSQQA